MTQDEIIEMAQKCGLVGMRPHLDGIYIESLLAFAKLVADKALAQTQEPVCPECKAVVLYECVACSSNNYPPQHKPLTDEEIDAVMPQPTKFGIVQPPWNGLDITILRVMARAIEAKLKEKNGG